MSFSKNLTITVRNTTAQLNEPLCVYEKDRNLMIYFKIMDYKYKFDKNPTNVLASVDDIMEAYATIVDPNGYELTRRYGEVIDDEIKFVITEDLIDEIEEIGTYKLQFHIKCKHSEFTIPEISFEVLERLKGIRTVTDEGVVGDTILNNTESFIDAEGKLNLVWQRGDTISSVRLNQMVEVINNAVDEEHQRQLNEVERENRANAKLNELETRFSALTTSQQQDAEVIDARDGEASLKARLDRDIEKAKQIYVDVEGSRISTDSAAGYLKDVEILGKTLVNLLQGRMVDLFCVNDNKSVFKAGKYTVININSKKIGIEVKSISSDEWKDGYTINPNGVSTLVELLDDAYIATIYGRSNNGWDSTNANELSKTIILEGDHTQNPPSYFEGIASVGDKVEGQELYEIPVVSCGKNLFDLDAIAQAFPNEITRIDNGIRFLHKVCDIGAFINFNPSKQYNLSWTEKSIEGNGNLAGFEFVYTDGTSNYMIASGNQCLSSSLNKQIKTIRISYNYAGRSELTNIQLEEGTVATPYEPYQEDKLTILSPVQLERVRNVADRIIEKDGVWGVEKNIETIVLNGSEGWSEPSANDNGVLCFQSRLLEIGVDNRAILCDNFNVVKGTNQNAITGDLQIIAHPSSAYSDRVYISLNEATNSSEFKLWLQANPTVLKYQLATPTFIPLPHDQQIKLRTFANKTNIQFLTTINGTIKAQLPKSLGATVNVQNEQISNLNKELDRVKKLEESTVSTVETESDFTTVEATSNGYFEDVKLEGKTLVNLANIKNVTLQATSGVNTNSDHSMVINGKSNTLYTVILNVKTMPTSGYVNCGIRDASNSHIKDLFKDSEIKQGLNITTFKSDVEFEIVRLLARNPTVGDAIIDYVTILEGDHTQNPPSFFEGLKSVGDGVDEIVVSSSNVFYKAQLDNFNLEPSQSNYGYDEGRRVAYSSLNLLVNMNFSEKLIDALDTQIPYLPDINLKLLFEAKGTVDRRFEVIFFDSNQVLIKKTALCLASLNTWNVLSCDIPSNARYFSIRTIYLDSQPGICFIDLDTIIINKSFKSPHQSDKKQILFYNTETQTWKKPILRQWDSIEKHADGKYYYHQRSGEVVLNGSEDWGTIQVQPDRLWFKSPLSNSIVNSKIICDKFKSVSDICDEDGIFRGSTSLGIGISKSKLPTQDTQGFKQWLQANNVTVVYQLAQEKVYECTNIDLITYANETNFIVECGPIVPRTTLKVHNNISNVVSLLQKKVSILESNFITMFKAVLSGDYQTLAYNLYPEDFNNTEDTNNQEE